MIVITAVSEGPTKSNGIANPDQKEINGKQVIPAKKTRDIFNDITIGVRCNSV